MRVLCSTLGSLGLFHAVGHQAGTRNIEACTIEIRKEIVLLRFADFILYVQVLDLVRRVKAGVIAVPEHIADQEQNVLALP